MTDTVEENDQMEAVTKEQRGPDEYRKNLVLGILAIGVGLYFLMANYGLIPNDLWRELFKLWPIVLVYVGIDLLGKTNRYFERLGKVLLVAMVFYLVLLIFLGK